MNVILNSLFWKFLERIGTQGIQFVISIILARLLLPEEYGLIGLITIFIAIANVFVQSGFNTALIQKKEVKESEYSSVLFFSIFISFVLYMILFFLAPFIASFYNQDILTLVIRCLSLTLPFGAVNSIQIAKISREFAFNKLFKSSMGAALSSGIIGIILAYKGFGVWSLVLQQLLNQVFVMIIMCFTVKWRPVLKFSFQEIRVLYKFGKNILVSNLIDTVYNNLYGLIIGKIFNASSLGYYNRADQFPKVIVSNINGSLQSVLLPTLSSRQDNKKKIKLITRKGVRCACFIIFPVMMGLMACSKEIVLLVLTEKWANCIIFIQILCFNYMFWPVHTTNLQAINALGRSDIYLKLEIMKKIFGIVGLIVSIPFGLKTMIISQAIISFVSIFINCYPNVVLLNYSIREQISDIFPTLFLSISMGVLVMILFNAIKLNLVLSLVMKVTIGICYYFLMSRFFHLKALKEVFIILQSMKGISK